MKKHVVLFSTSSSQKKIDYLCSTAQSHFEKKEHLLIFTPDQKISTYVDELFWKYPEESFLPHLVSSDPCKDWLAITSTRKNINQAKFVFNLCPTPILSGDFLLIYDFDDNTSSYKKMLSQKKFEAYRDAKWVIESR